MIDKIYGKYHISCDQCGEEYEKVFETFDGAVDETVEAIKFCGWRTSRIENIWQHQCSGCSGFIKKGK